MVRDAQFAERLLDVLVRRIPADTQDWWTGKMRLSTREECACARNSTPVCKTPAGSIAGSNRTFVQISVLFEDCARRRRGRAHHQQCGREHAGRRRCCEKGGPHLASLSCVELSFVFLLKTSLALLARAGTPHKPIGGKQLQVACGSAV